MTTVAPQIRLNLLLMHLRSGRWRTPPSNVGLKTGLTALELGLVEAKGDLRSRSYRLTAAGAAYVASAKT